MCLVKRISLNDDQFRQTMVGDNAAEYGDRVHQHKVKQKEDEVWFDKLDENMCTFKHKVHNWLKQGEESLVERQTK